MRLSNKQVEKIADLLMLKYYVFVHKVTGKYCYFTSTDANALDGEEREQWKQVEKHLSRYLCIDPPGKEMLIETYALFGTRNSTLRQWRKLRTRSQHFVETGDFHPLYIALKRYNFLSEWEQHVKMVHEDYVKAVILPWNQCLVHLQ